jgi:outer membrane lipoprotein-sorting protein
MILACLAVPAFGAESPETALALIKKSDWQMHGKNLEARILMRVVRGPETRSLEFLLWSKGTEKAVVKVLSPAKERSSSHLRLGTDLWIYAPDVERVQKVAPSMMRQSWMGADFSNGDLIRSTNLARYFDHRIVADDRIDGQAAYKIESRPKKDSPIDGGKIITWLTHGDAVQLRQEYYDASGKLERSVISKNFKKQGEHHYPATLVVTKAGEVGSFTQVDYRSMRFDRPLDETIFTQEFMRKRIDAPDLPKP